MYRKDLHQLLLKEVPLDRIRLGRKVLSILQNQEGVMIRCSNNKTYHADILIGSGKWLNMCVFVYLFVTDEWCDQSVAHCSFYS